MYYSTTYRSPVGILTLASDGEALAGLWISGQKYYGGSLSGKMTERDGLSVFTETKDWLDRYFAGEKPAICELELAPAGTAFQQTIWKLLCQIPYGQVTPYGALARQAAEVPQSDLYHHSLPPGHWERWKPDRLCGGNPCKGQTS